MAILIKRYEDGTSIPLFKPWVRRIEYGTAKKKKSLVRRVASKMLDNAASGIIRGTGNNI